MLNLNNKPKTALTVEILIYYKMYFCDSIIKKYILYCAFKPNYAYCFVVCAPVTKFVINDV